MTEITEKQHEIVLSMQRQAREFDENTKKWIEELKNNGIKMAHPDDGWVYRDENYLVPCYPYFITTVQIGDSIALGDYKKYRVVKINRIDIIYKRTRRFYFTEEA